MDRIMSTRALLFVLLCFTLSFPSTQGTLPPKAVNHERINWMKIPLYWITFRKNGQLASDQDLEPYFEALKVNYADSTYFRTLIVAFKDGVLPRLTLNENDGCDPAYTKEYRDRFNNSVTYGFLKKFIFKYYDERSQNGIQFCDYRQVLVCIPQTNKCECPKGSRMGPISQGSSVFRCLVQENEICALIDLDHDPTSDYGALKKVFPEMLFNLEKPPSCQMETQCRFKSNTQTRTSCYENNGGPWAKGRWELDFGEECTLGLYAEKYACRNKKEPFVSDYIGVMRGYTCFSFGVVKPPLPAQVGVCVHDIGSYGVTSQSSISSSGRPWKWNPLFIGSVNPATTSLRGAIYRDYITKFMSKVESAFTNSGVGSTFTDVVNGNCSVVKTEEVLDHWKFYISLEGTPPRGQDHVASEAELQNRLQKLVDLAIGWPKKSCKAYAQLNNQDYDYIDDNGDGVFDPSLRCIAHGGAPDQYGNDGRCERVPRDQDETLVYAEKFKTLVENIEDIDSAQRAENNGRHRPELAGGVECDPKLGPPPGSEGAPKSPPEDNDVLEGGYCPPDRGCYLNFGDYLGSYDKNCNWKYNDGEKRLFRDCQWLDEQRKWGKCERGKLDEKIREVIIIFSSKNSLGRGETCDNNFEKTLRKIIRNGGSNIAGNKYKILWQMQNAMNNVKGLGFCDRTKLLECTDQNTCECFKGTAPRITTVGGKVYMSDYCYFTSGECYYETLDKIYNADKACSPNEYRDIVKHYKAKRKAKPGEYRKCDRSNWCVFVDENNGKGSSCTTKNTGNTGFVPKEGGCPHDDPFCDYEDAGKGENQLHQSLKIVMIIVMMITI